MKAKNFEPTDIVGERFGRWYVQSHTKTTDDFYKLHWYRCSCDCGAVREVQRGNLITGASKSCGCMRVESTKNNSGRPKKELA